MANADTPNGFLATPLLRARPYSVDSSNGTALFINDLVEMEADGNIAAGTVSDDHLIGSTLDYLAVSTAGTVAVADHPQQEFHAQDDGGGVTTQLSVFQNCDHVAGAGSTTTLLSAHELGFGTLAATVKTFRILDLVANSENAHGANAVWRVLLNEHANNYKGAVVSDTGI